MTGSDYAQFLLGYEATYGELPTELFGDLAEQLGTDLNMFHAHAYDATVMLLTAIEDAAQVQGDSMFIDRQALREALYTTRDFAGLTGTLACDSFGDCGTQKMSIIQHLDPSAPRASRENVVYNFAPQS